MKRADVVMLVHEFGRTGKRLVYYINHTLFGTLERRRDRKFEAFVFIPGGK
jgi:hypothetical protein